MIMKINKISIMNDMNKLVTERLILRKLKREDAESMFNNWCKDPEVAKYTTWTAHENVEVTKALVNMWVEEEKSGANRFVITLKGNDEPIGMIDVVDYCDGIPEIGYCLSRKHWNKGYMSEACKAFVNYLFELGYPKILIRADERNIGSNRVIEKCGFTFTHKEKLEMHSKEKPESVIVNKYEIKKPE